MNLKALIAEQRRYEEFSQKKRENERTYGDALERIEQIQKEHPNSKYVQRRMEELKQYMRKNSPRIRVGKKKGRGKYKQELDEKISVVTQLRIVLSFAQEAQQALFTTKRNLLSKVVEDDDTDWRKFDATEIKLLEKYRRDHKEEWARQVRRGNSMIKIADRIICEIETLIS